MAVPNPEAPSSDATRTAGPRALVADEDQDEDGATRDVVVLDASVTASNLRRMERQRALQSELQKELEEEEKEKEKMAAAHSQTSVAGGLSAAGDEDDADMLDQMTALERDMEAHLAAPADAGVHVVEPTASASAASSTTTAASQPSRPLPPPPPAAAPRDRAESPPPREAHTHTQGHTLSHTVAQPHTQAHIQAQAHTQVQAPTQAQAAASASDADADADGGDGDADHTVTLSDHSGDESDGSFGSLTLRAPKTHYSDSDN